MAEESKGGEEAINTTDGSGDSSDHNKSTGGSSGSGGNGSTGNLFAVGESTDKGLADMETGSEVYMSELLVSKACMLGWIPNGRTVKATNQLLRMISSLISLCLFIGWL